MWSLLGLTPLVGSSELCTTMSRVAGHAGTDWGEVTALATAALVFVAGLAAWYAKRDIEAHLKTAADDLHATREATKAAQEAAQSQLRASYRPLLIELPSYGPADENDPVLEGGPDEGRVPLSFPGGHEGTAELRGVYVALSGPRINVSVLLRNVGNGLAVIHPMQVQLLGQRMLPQRLGEYVTKIERPRVPPGETTRILHAPTISHTEMVGYPWVLTLRVPYWDFAGEEGWVALIFLEQAYQDEPWSLREIRHEALKPAEADGEATQAGGTVPHGAAQGG
jgi:hypothetical protein